MLTLVFPVNQEDIKKGRAQGAGFKGPLYNDYIITISPNLKSLINHY